MHVCMDVFLYVSMYICVSRSGFIYTGVSTSIYFCLVPDVTASIWIAYNRVWCVNGIRNITLIKK